MSHLTNEEKFKICRIQIFASTWLSYVGFYFCRQAFYVVKPELTNQLKLDSVSLGNIGMAYLIAYTFAQFLSAAVGEKTGARILLLCGMGISITCNIIFGFANNYWTFLAFMIFNGLGQGTGWSGNVGTMANWFRRNERGTVMGFWSTCYQVGGAIAKGFAAYMLGLAGWRWSFWGASIVLAFIWLFFLYFQRNCPEDVGLPPIVDDIEADTSNEKKASCEVGGKWTADMIISIIICGIFYFFVKYIRYALWSWSPYFLKFNFNLPSDKAGYFSTIFDVAGFFGVISAGLISDKLFKGKRTQTSLIMMIGMTEGTLLLFVFGGSSLLIFAISIGIIGYMLYGPDSLLTGAGAIDIGSRRHAIAAAGIINGMGAIGSIVQEPVIGYLYKRFNNDINPVLQSLLLAAIFAATALAVLNWRSRTGRSEL